MEELKTKAKKLRLLGALLLLIGLLVAVPVAIRIVRSRAGRAPDK